MSETENRIFYSLLKLLKKSLSTLILKYIRFIRKNINHKLIHIYI